MEENLEIKLFYKYKPKFHLVVASRHDTLSSPCTLAWGKVVTWRDKTCRACRTAQRDTLVARLARHAFRGVATAWTGVDMSISLFPEVVSEIDTNPEHNRLNFTREHYCFFAIHRDGTSTARHARHDARDTHMSYVSCRDLTWRAKWNLGYIYDLSDAWCTDYIRSTKRWRGGGS